MPVVSAPCSCQSDCLVWSEEVPPHVVASTFYWNRWCFKNEYGTASPPEARLRKFYRGRKEYLPRALHMTEAVDGIFLASSTLV
ncbi:hypothetical protein TNCV_1426921 [Trichonephila clavipes]|nr:hypothetical protein TNCV_1426921 [Trichonephila clavipes]